MNLLRTHSLALFLITASLALAFMGHETFLALQYERTGISEGELWRLLSGHLIHMGWAHLWINLAALLIIWAFMHGFLTTLAWWSTAATCSIGISVCLYLFMPSLDWYVGLSGLLHSLIITGSIAGFRQGRQEFALLVFFICAKVIWEQYYNPLSTGIFMLEGDIIVNSHLYGMIMGLICALFIIAVSSRYTGRPAG